METAAAATRNLVRLRCNRFCPIAVKIRDGRGAEVTCRDHPLFKDVICKKGACSPKSFARPDRLTYSQQRKGARGRGEWERVCRVALSRVRAGDFLADEISGDGAESRPSNWPCTAATHSEDTQSWRAQSRPASHEQQCCQREVA